MPRRVRPAPGDEGVSLIEMLVVLLLMAIVSTVVVKAVTTTMRVTRVSTQRSVGLAALQTASDRLSRELRAAEPLVAASGSSFTTYVLRDGKKVEFVATFTATTPVTLTLRQRVFNNPAVNPATATADVTATSTLLKDVQAPASGSYFTWTVDTAGTQVSAPTAAQIATAFQVTQSFGVKTTGRSISTSTTVSLRNSSTSTG